MLFLDKNEQKEISNYILQILDEHKQDGIEAHDVHNKLKYIVIDPLLYNDEIYQIRHNKTYISWHKNYIDIIKKLKLIPSKTFADIIINFSCGSYLPDSIVYKEKCGVKINLIANKVRKKLNVFFSQLSFATS